MHVGQIYGLITLESCSFILSIVSSSGIAISTKVLMCPLGESTSHEMLCLMKGFFSFLDLNPNASARFTSELLLLPSYLLNPSSSGDIHVHDHVSDMIM